MAAGAPAIAGVLRDASLGGARGTWIAGEWEAEGELGTLGVTDPATGKEIARVPKNGAADAARAVAAAKDAFPAWAALPAKQRSSVLRRWYDLIVENTDDLAALMTAEAGKPLAESRGEVAYAAVFVEWFAEEGRRIAGDVLESPVPGRRIVSIKQPVGVVAAITPWNFPLAMVTRKVAPALAVGCTVVIKPSEETPLSCLALLELAERAGVPAGVLNAVMGDAPAIGGVLCSSKAVRKLTFTGSTAVGKILLKQCADTVKKVSLELGGNAPLLVFEDADLDAAVAGCLSLKFKNAGQVCVTVNRAMVHESVYDDFCARLAEATSKLSVGPGGDAGVQMGPLINERAPDRAAEHVADAVSRGAECLTGGARYSDERPASFFQPTVLKGVTPDMRIYREETFGPVAGVVRFSTEEEAVAMANDTDYGLAAYLYTKDMSRSWRVAEALEYGIVGVNETACSNEIAPFGGCKESGLGREGGLVGVDDFLEIKGITFGAI
uniref:Succinate-semialdehyde dehydrogenase n=1 Tax=Prasinoderma coloniale TaxID=156133 RepID=A0A7R9TZU9_9VIRI